jgi:hypothetical protein
MKGIALIKVVFVNTKVLRISFLRTKVCAIFNVEAGQKTSTLKTKNFCSCIVNTLDSKLS